jgi:hypothetical protein
VIAGKRAPEWDRARRRRLKRLGWDVVEVTDDQVTRQGRQTAAELVELFQIRRRSVLSSDGPGIPADGRQND